MVLPDDGNIAGRSARFRLVQRVSISSLVANGLGGTQVVVASSFSNFQLATAINLPFQTGQAIQIRDAWCSCVDDGGTPSGKLNVMSIALVLLGPGAGQMISQRGAFTSNAATGNVSGAGPSFVGPVFGTTDWPFITTTDFPQFGSLAPNLRLAVNGVVQNTDGAASHQLDINAGVLFEVWSLDPDALKANDRSRRR